MDHSDSETEDMAELSPEQMDVLVQLQEITGLEDLAVCRALLESSNWDLESVAREQLGLGGPLGGGEPEVGDSEGEASDPEPRHQPQPLARHAASPLGWLLYIITIPNRIIAGGFNIVWSVVSSLFGMSPPNPNRQSGDGRADVAEFVREYSERYGSSHPPFNRGGYYQVLEEAKRDLRFLLVYLHSEEHQDTDNFCRNVLSSDAVKGELETSNIILWGCSVSRTEGYKVSQALRETSYPFLAMIVLRQHRMVVVSRQEGSLVPEAMVEWIRNTVTEYEAFIVAARTDRDERNFDRELRNQQEAEFAESLRRDQEREQRERERRLKREAKARQEAEEKKMREEEKKRKKMAVKEEREKMAREKKKAKEVGRRAAVTSGGHKGRKLGAADQVPSASPSKLTEEEDEGEQGIQSMEYDAPIDSHPLLSHLSSGAPLHSSQNGAQPPRQFVEPMQWGPHHDRVILNAVRDHGDVSYSIHVAWEEMGGHDKSPFTQQEISQRWQWIASKFSQGEI